MANLTNTTKINNYQFNVTTGQTSNGSSNSASVTINVTEATVVFAKANNPQYITLGGSSTITYSITNTNSELLTTAIIVDPIFALPGVTFTNLQNATLSGTTLTVNLGTGLAQNSTVRVTVTVNVATTAIPSSTVYNTTATGTFTIATLPITTIIKTAKGLLEANAAIIQLVKSLVPNVANITAGNLLTYTITATNSGNVSATIPIGQFTDSWNSNGLTNVQTTTSGFQITSNSITNSTAITINAGETFTLTYTGNASVPI